MPLHLKKLCVGIEDADHLARVQAARYKQFNRRAHRTRMMPKRVDEVLDGGSMYWIIKGVMLVRQPITLIESGIVDDDDPTKPFCLIHLAEALIPIEPRQHRPFQGWRYLPAADAPPDLPKGHQPATPPPPEMAAELRRLGLL